MLLLPLLLMMIMMMTLTTMTRQIKAKQTLSIISTSDREMFMMKHYRH
jgi:uncharacterized membrane protein